MLRPRIFMHGSIMAELSGFPSSTRDEDEKLRSHSRDAVENDISHRPRARRKERLMPFIQARHERSHQNRVQAPGPGPSWIPTGRNGGAPRAKQQDAEDAVPNHVPTLAQEKVPPRKAHGIQ